jgi:hypothetical protein
MSFTGYFDAQILIITVEELCTLKLARSVHKYSIKLD